MIARSLLFVSALALASPALAQDKTVNMQLESGYASTLGLLGPAAKTIADDIEALTGGTVKFRTFEPGALVPVLQIPDAISQGSLDAAFGATTWWAGKDQAFNFFTAVPFGPNAAEFLAWIKHGGGQELADELFAKHNTKGLFCHLLPPEPSGWYREEMNSIDDFKGLRMRIAGYGASVLEKLGGSPQLTAPGDIYQALEQGVIDATEFSVPSLDLKIGLYQVAKHYYFSGWHQQHGFNMLWINLDKWNALSEGQQRAIEVTCDAMLLNSLAESEAAQAEALKELEDKGVTLHRWSPEVLAELQKVWEEVAADLAANDPSFAKVWKSLSDFRGSYASWAGLSSLSAE